MRFRTLVVLVAVAFGCAEVRAQSLRVSPYLTGLDQPVALVADPTDDHRQFVVEKTGRLRLVIDGVLRVDPVLDLHTQVASAGEQGLLGMAVDPQFATTGRLWLNFTRQPDGATVIARFTRAAGAPFRFDPATRLDLRFSGQPEERFIAQPAANHNGGKLLFDAQGFLLVAMGDGGGANDAYRRAQDPQSLLGKILRIDVAVPDQAAAPLEQREEAARGYRVPPTNPFVDGVPIAARPEIWAFGLRNPWRVTLDDPALGGTGALLIGDVGQGAREEVDFEPAGRGGRNYGWPLREGTLTNGSSPPGVVAAVLPLVGPVHEYPRTDGISITGGYIYRGRLLGEAFGGRYVFGDLSNRLRSVGLTVDEGGMASAGDVREHTDEVGGLSGSLVSIDTDPHGELFLVMLSGTILRLTTSGDADGDGIEDAWASRFGLAGLPAAARGPFGDPDGDGLVNAREYRQGSHPEGGPVALFGEGATTTFELFLLLGNPSADTARVRVDYLRQGATAVSRTYAVPAASRLTIWVNQEPGLDHAELGAVVVSVDGVPITAERAMYTRGGATPFTAGHAAAGEPAPGTRWVFAEGSPASGAGCEPYGCPIGSPGGTGSGFCGVYGENGRCW